MRTGSRRVPAHPGRVGDDSAEPGAAGRLQTAVARLADPVARAAGLDLEAVQIGSAGRRRVLRVVVDAPGGAGVDAMAVASQALSAKLDATGIMGEAPYTLEVTSPGVDRPLTAPRHWQRAAGRLVHVAAGGRDVSGRVVAAGDEGVVLDAGGVRREYSFAELGPGKVQVEFRRDDMGESRGH